MFFFPFYDMYVHPLSNNPGSDYFIEQGKQVSMMKIIAGKINNTVLLNV